MIKEKIFVRGFPNMMRLLLFFFTVSLHTGCGIKKSASLPVFSHNPFHREFPRLSESQIDSLSKLYGDGKTFINEYLEPTLIALSHYPELKDVQIEFRYSKEKTTMAARPIPITVLGKHRYQILINNQADFEGILLSDVPFNAQIGIIAHELSHIADYHSHNLWGILGVSFRYFDRHRKPLFEKEIDMHTVLRGLGWQLYDWAMFSMYGSNRATEEYKMFKRATYMKPEEIEQMILHLSRYSSGLPSTPNIQTAYPNFTSHPPN